ncbi:hypothetical protein Pyn_18443 [Prunus yedoensis var. nudiflora]|uniref:Uncharacterized protein n=1 Tax=Prunus yedoensis var. nudiflora TaxID=2094558 RepID=A0A314ZK56_PRUYE|nr:hypothetical protein Pyn_18443 [Prunus yedoensis var. nudiflora]
MHAIVQELVLQCINRGDSSFHIKSHHDRDFGFIKQQPNWINSRFFVYTAKLKRPKLGEKQSHRFCSFRTHSKKKGWVAIIKVCFLI